MIIVLHILTAILSIVAGSLAFWRPSRARLGMSYSLITLTVLSGVIVAVTAQVRIQEICLTGLLYVGGMIVLSIATQRKLAHLPVRIDD